MRKIAIIGANEFQKRLVLKAREMDIETHVFAWEEGAVAKEVADFFYPISITDKEQILEVLKAIEVDGICSIASDLAMPTVNYVTQKLNLVGNSEECTILTTNKYEMRKKLNEEGMPIPEFQLIKEEDDINWSIINYPVIVKPIDRSGSRGIYKVINEQELKVAIRNAKEVSFTDFVLVEEYIEGKEYSVEAISQNGKHKILQVTEKFTSGAPNFIETAHISPARIDNNLKALLVQVIEESLRVLEVKNGASHSEIKVAQDGNIKIIEIAARMGGDFIGSDMVKISTGFDFLKSVIEVSLGLSGKFVINETNETALVKFIFEKDDIQNFYKIRTRYPEIIDDYFISKEIKSVSDSSTRNGYYILKIQNRNQLVDIIDILELNK